MKITDVRVRRLRAELEPPFRAAWDPVPLTFFGATLVFVDTDEGITGWAFMRGQPFSSDSDERWRSMVRVAREVGIEIRPELTVQLDRDVSSPELGYPVIQHLLSNREQFTAVVAFNDMSAIGAIRALQDSGMQVPADVSVTGFDDINAAAFSNPRLTTIRQPLANMGRMAAQCVLNRIHGRERFRKQIIVEPELVVRESTRAIQPGNPPVRPTNLPARFPTHTPSSTSSFL